MRTAITALALAAAATLAQARDKVTFLTSWYAQAEHGGYYQAIANGTYRKHGLDVTVKMGGPQVNAVQLLAAGQADFMMGKDFQVLNALQSGVPMTTVRATLEGWKSYLDNPVAGNALIKQDNPKMDDGTLAFAHRKLKEMKFFNGGDASKLGAGIMTDARWEKTYQFMVTAELLKPMPNWKDAYTLQFVKDLKVMP